ncbi:MAG: NAD(P) transhydrogenase subunit alpha [Planctomycetes bacterium]|nr:NAD(P) transhydrogenase subunit alpha [Planctomycetota bacterium]
MEAPLRIDAPVIDTVSVDPLILSLTVFVLACFIGYYVVWRVTPALHSPLMAVTNAISSVIIVGALIAAGAHARAQGFEISQMLGFAAITLAAVNIFGGFVIAQRMLDKFRKKRPGPVPDAQKKTAL